MKVGEAAYVIAVLLSLAVLVGSMFMLRYAAPDGLVAESGESVVLLGSLKTTRLPVKWFGAAPPAGETRKYIEVDVLTLEAEEPGAGILEYLLYTGGIPEMVLLGGGNTVIGGLTLDEINDAYKVGAQVEVAGGIYKLTREDTRDKVITVGSIEILDRSALPLVIYHTVLEQG